MRIDWVGRAGLLIVVLGSITSTLDAQRVASGTTKTGKTWQAQSYIVGVNSTGTIASGGDSRYLAVQPAYSGVVTLIMNYGPDVSFICSGTLLPDRVSILTAAHCVSDGTTGRPLSTTVFFPNSDPEGLPSQGANVGSRSVTLYNVHPSFTGEVIDQNDIAVLRMNAPAPATARSYSLFAGSGLTSTQFNVAGYGERSDAGGNVGANLGAGRLRQGQNRYDFRFGDADFDNFWVNLDGNGENAFGKAQIAHSYVSDFDNGRTANDASCRLAAFFSLGGGKYCNLGLGLDEVAIGGGDSGGPQFVNGEISSVTSYGLSFGEDFGYITAGLNSSFGEFNGFVPVFIHTAFINASMVPEPAAVVLMITGLAILGVIARRRREY